jgi:hypothetical protein
VVVSNSYLLADDGAIATACLARIMDAANSWFSHLTGLAVAARPAVGSPLEQGHGFDGLVTTATTRREAATGSTWTESGPAVGLPLSPLVTRYWNSG